MARVGWIPTLALAVILLGCSARESLPGAGDPPAELSTDELLVGVGSAAGSGDLETISIGGVELDSVPDAGPDEHTRELEQTGVVLRLHLVPRLDSPVFR